MQINNVDIDNKIITINIPLTTTSGKTRVKQRDNIYGYGLPFASRQNPFNQRNYIEWQIGYDATLPGNIDEFKEKDYKNYINTTLKDVRFVGDNGKYKTLYELSEYLYYFTQMGVFTKNTLTELLHSIQSIDNTQLLDKHEHCQINRTHPTIDTINGLDFEKMIIKYPQLLYKFGGYEIIAEITIKEKQRAVGTQPMLYFCFPITELKSQNPLIGRIAEVKEFATFEFNQDNCFIILEMIKIFGMLSKSHKFDTIAIITVILENLCQE